MSRRDLILDTIEDLVSDFLYYGRKEDEELPIGAIEEAIELDEIAVWEIYTQFQVKLKEKLNEN